MKTEEAVTTVLGGGAGASPLGTHAFLDQFALAYHRAVADRMRAEPAAVLAHVRRNLDRWMEGDTFGPGHLASLEEWRGILDEADVGRLVEIITDASDEGQRLRSWRWRAMQCFRPFHTAERTIEGVEALHMMRKGQVKRLDGRDAIGQAKFVASLFGVAA